MIIYAAKLHRKRIALGAVAFVLVCGLLAGIAGSFTMWGAQNAIATTVSPKGVKTNQDRIAYLAQFGWETSPEAVTVEEIQIPDSMDASFDDYLALQTEQGYTLSDFSGKKVKRYTYSISNYPDSAQEAMASLLIYKNNVVGAEVFSAKNGELLHGLQRPA